MYHDIFLSLSKRLGGVDNYRDKSVLFYLTSRMRSNYRPHCIKICAKNPDDKYKKNVRYITFIERKKTFYWKCFLRIFDTWIYAWYMKLKLRLLVWALHDCYNTFRFLSTMHILLIFWPRDRLQISLLILSELKRII